jgi:integrase
MFVVHTPAMSPKSVPLANEIASSRNVGRSTRRGPAYLFVSPHGTVANDSTVREWWGAAVNATLVTEAPQLAGIMPHAMHHAGMTYSFAQGIDQKRIQSRAVGHRSCRCKILTEASSTSWSSSNSSGSTVSTTSGTSRAMTSRN